MTSKLSPKIVSVWHSAAEAFDAERLNEARELFRQIQDHSAKILFNLGVVDFLCQEHAAAYEKLSQCLDRDPYLAVAYFHRGLLGCFLERLENAKQDFVQAEQNIRNGEYIDYHQLGMPVKLTKEQVQHNQKVVLEKIRTANSSRKIADSDLITLPLKTCIFRPAKSLVDNLEKKQFLPQSKVVSYVTGYGIEDSDRFRKPELKSQSTPVSPAASRKVPQETEMVLSRGGRASTPPPSRPPPRAPPPSSAVTAASHGHTNSNSSLRGTEGVLLKSPPQAVSKEPQWNKGSNSKTHFALQTKESCLHGSVPAREPGVAGMIKKLDGCSVAAGKNLGNQSVTRSTNTSLSFLPHKESEITEQRRGPPMRQPPPRPDVLHCHHKPKS